MTFSRRVYMHKREIGKENRPTKEEQKTIEAMREKLKRELKENKRLLEVTVRKPKKIGFQ